ncbi:MAG: hypothetical protein HYS13_10460 [Planctomycetia bacterium]|nr:hypothetical protein [Planctomycetia bacterium]
MDGATIRAQGRRLSFRSATAHSYSAWLLPVTFALNDHLGGWAEWRGQIAFCEGIADRLIGHVGFLEFFDYGQRAGYFELEPKSGFPGQFQCALTVRRVTTRVQNP